MKNTYRLKCPEDFDRVAQWAWSMMESSHSFFAHDGELMVLDDSEDFNDPTWVGHTFGEFESWLIQCFQEWVASGPAQNPMWEVICEYIRL